MQCPHCQADVSAGTEICPACGVPIEAEPTLTYVPVASSAHPSLTPDEASHVRGFRGHALVVERGPRAGMTWVLAPGRITVGRHPDADIFLDDITVSRKHCSFTVEGEHVSVQDEGSTNGTYVNGDRVDQAELGPGDEVIIGKFHLIVAHGDE